VALKEKVPFWAFKGCVCLIRCYAMASVFCAIATFFSYMPSQNLTFTVQDFSLHLHQLINIKLMKKQLFALSIIVTCFFKSNAQSLQLLDTTAAHGGVGSLAQSIYNLTVDTSASGSILFNVKNVTSSAISIKVKKHLISNAGGDGITFCVGSNCYSSTTTLSPVAVSIPANSLLTNGLTTDFTATNIPNTAAVVYTVFNNANPNDSVSVRINYNVVNNTAGIKQITGINNQIAVYPNPASSEVSFTCDLSNVNQSATVKIYNMLGSLVKTIPLESNTTTEKIDISSLEEGVYVYSFIVGGKAIKTSRLVVSR
jgi:hypothetical protein